jgi:hypothetical protein
MKYRANTRRKAIEYEKDLVQYWKKHQTFEKSVEQRPKEGTYVFLYHGKRAADSEDIVLLAVVNVNNIFCVEIFLKLRKFEI